jgi:hypothetical protein
MTDDLMENYLALGSSMNKTMLMLGIPDQEKTEIVLRNEIEATYDNVSAALSDNSKLTTDQRTKALQNWFDQSTLIQDQFNYLLSWTNGSESYPVFLHIVFINSKLVSSEILVKQ